MKMNKMLRCLIMLTIVVGVSSMAFGADPNWIGVVDTNWHTAGNWDTIDREPNAVDNIKIGDPNYIDKYTYPITVNIDAAANANSISIGAGTTVSDVTTVNLNSGLLTVGGDLTIGMVGDVGKVTFIADANSVIGDDLTIGSYGDCVLDANDVYLDINDKIDIGRTATGTVTLNSSYITTSADVANASELRVGDQAGGNGKLIMNGTSYVETIEQDASIGGRDGNGTGTLEMNDSSQLIVEDNDSKRSLRLGYSLGTGTIEMNDTSYLSIDHALKAGGKNVGVGIVTMTGGEISTDQNTYFGGVAGGDHTYWGELGGDNTRGILTMSGEALFYSDGYFFFGIESDIDKIGSANRNELIMSDTAKISVRDGDQNMYIASNAGSYVYVEVNDDAEINCKDLEIGRNGGGCDFTVNDGRLNIDDHFLVASSVDSPAAVDPVNILIDDNAVIDINNRFRIGGLGAKVTITFKDGDINMADGTDELAMPYSGPSGVGGYAKIILGEDDITKSKEDAEFVLDGYLDASDAGDNDYIDFLAGGILKTRQTRVPEQDIKDHIVSGYFRTTYTQATLYGETSADPNCFRPVYSSADNGIRWDVELGIGLICVDPPAGDLDGDCDVDLDDLAILAAAYTTTYDLEDFAVLAADWGKCEGRAYGYTCP